MEFDISSFTQRVLAVTALIKNARLQGVETNHLWDIMLEENNDLSQLALTANTPKEISELTQAVIDTQEIIVKKNGIPYVDNLEYYKQGQLVVCYMTISTCMGTAEAVSRGFFNSCDYPPYSTWLYWFPSTKKSFEHLLTWIPPEFIEGATEAIESVAEEHILFVTDEYFVGDYKSELEKAGLLI